MIYEFLTPVDKDSILEGEELQPGQIGNYIYIFDGKEPETGWFDIALIGVPDDRGSTANVGSAKAADLVRHGGQLHDVLISPPLSLHQLL